MQHCHTQETKLHSHPLYDSFDDSFESQVSHQPLLSDSRLETRSNNFVNSEEGKIKSEDPKPKNTLLNKLNLKKLDLSILNRNMQPAHANKSAVRSQKLTTSIQRTPNPKIDSKTVRFNEGPEPPHPNRKSELTSSEESPKEFQRHMNSLIGGLKDVEVSRRKSLLKRGLEAQFSYVREYIEDKTREVRVLQTQLGKKREKKQVFKRNLSMESSKKSLRKKAP